MTPTTIELTGEEIARRGEELYYRDILPQIAAGNDGRVVAIDIHTGAFELADDVKTSTSRLWERAPAAEIFLMRVGYPTFSRLRPFGQQRNRNDDCSHGTPCRRNCAAGRRGLLPRVAVSRLILPDPGRMARKSFPRSIGQ